MTPAEFAAKSASLGLSTHWLANKLKVKPQVVEGWKRGYRNGYSSWPSEEAMRLVDEVGGLFDEVSYEEAKFFVSRYPEEIFLFRYLTNEDLAHNRDDLGWLGVQAHTLLLWRIKQEIEKISPSTTVHIVNMVPKLYEEWRKANNLEDYYETRVAWVQTEVKPPAYIPKPSRTLPQLGVEIRHQRQKLDMTLEEVAEKTGVTLEYVCNIENGRGNPTFVTLNRLAQALETSLVDLLGGKWYGE